MPRRVTLPPQLTFGAFSVSEGLAAGVGEGRLRGEDLSRPFHGVRSSADRPQPTSELDSILRRCGEYETVLSDTSYFSHDTAARLWGCPMAALFAQSDAIHVTALAPRNAPRGSGVIGHRADPPQAIAQRWGLPVSDPASTWLALAATLPLDELVVVGDHLLCVPAVLDQRDPRPYLTLAALAARVDGFHGRGARTARATLPLLRTGSASRPESLLRLLLVGHGIPEPKLNLDVHTSAGTFIGRGDLVWPQFRTVVEYDGDQHRTSTEQYEKDIARVDQFIGERWNYVRVRKRGLFVDRTDTIRRVEAALARGGWRP